jgi:hypothetical protein
MADTGTGVHNQQQMSSLQSLVNQYNGVDKVPLAALKNAGFVNQNDAFNAMMDMGEQAYGGKGNIASRLVTSPLDLVANTGKGIFNILKANSAGQGYRNAQAQAATTGALTSSMANTAPKDDYAAQYGPGGTAGRSNTSLAPVPGGVNYGTTANGSLIGVGDSVARNAAAAAIADPTGGLGAAPNYSDYMNKLTPPTYVGLPNAPKPTPFVINDFTPKATQMTATAYSPAFAAIDLAGQNAKTNYGNAQTEVAGVYKNLGNDITAQGNALDAKYAAAKAASQADTKAAESAVNAPALAAAQALAATGAGMGAGGYANQLNGITTADAARQSGDIATLGLNDTQAEGQHQLAYDTANTGLNSAAATQGAYGQQNLANQLASTLTGYEQNRLNLGSEEALKTLDLAQQLSGQDLSLQQSNAQQGQTYYGELLDAANAKNQLIGNTYGAQVTAANNAYNNAYTAYNDQRSAMQAAQNEADLNNYRTGSLATSTNNALINASTANGTTPKAPDTGAYGVFSTEIDNIFSNNPTMASTVKDFLSQQVLSMTNQGTAPSKGQFLQQALTNAPAGVDATSIYAAVDALYGSGAVAGWPDSKTY